MKKKAMVLIMIVLLSAIFISGCTGTSSSSGDVKSDADVQKTVGDVSNAIDTVQSTLNDIDSELG